MTPPKNISAYARLCLQALVERNLGNAISLGGAFGLLHYLDYRATHDVDAWWVSPLSSARQEEVLKVIETALQSFGPVRKRAWGDVVSIELTEKKKRVFSFQIAHRSAQLQASTSAQWTEVLLDSWPDLVAGKMVALVERGAPRDFRDIQAVCQAGLTTATECWQWWRQRQQLANSDTDPHRARLAVETHLARIVQHRPLSQIAEPAQRAEIEQIRKWFMTEFVDALSD